MLLQGEWADRRSAVALGFLGKPVRGIQMKGRNSHWERGVWGVMFPDFHPSPSFPRGGGIFSLFSLDQKWHGVSA